MSNRGLEHPLFTRLRSPFVLGCFWLAREREPRLRTGGCKVFVLKRKLVGKKTDPRRARAQVYAKVDIQRTWAFQESKETSRSGVSSVYKLSSA